MRLLAAGKRASEIERELHISPGSDSALNQGHALAWADFDADGSDELAAGWRGKPWGLAIYKRTAAGEWVKTQIEDGVAVEDLAIEDLNGDGAPAPGNRRPAP